MKDPNFIGVTVKTVVLTLTTVITLCKGFQIASFIKGLRSQGLQSAEQITGLIQNLRNAEQRYLKLEPGSLIWLQGRNLWTSHRNKEERIARPESCTEQASHESGAVQSDI